jgi:tagatose-1,6-bisphosphate aldolase non-catalytic subunit AgaZ/GatZ
VGKGAVAQVDQSTKTETMTIDGQEVPVPGGMSVKIDDDMVDDEVNLMEAAELRGLKRRGRWTY